MGDSYFQNRRNGQVYKYLGEVILNKAPDTVMKDGTILALTQLPDGKVLARSRKEFRSARFVPLTEKKALKIIAERTAATKK